MQVRKGGIASPGLIPLIRIHSLVEPLGQYRSLHVIPADGKRIKKRKRKQASVSQHFPEGANTEENAVISVRPEIHEYVTVGFNSTTRHLETLAKGGYETQKLAKMAAVFVPLKDAKASMIRSHLPLLCKTASKARGTLQETRLLSLPKGAEARLATALGIHRVGTIGVMEDGPDSAPLLNYVRQQVSPLYVPWLDQVEAGVYLPTQIKNVETTAPQDPKSKNKPSKLSEE